MRKWLRILFQIPPPAISLHTASVIAQNECHANGWEWKPPVLMRETLRCYEFVTNSSYKGGNVLITVDCVTGRILIAAITPR